MRDPLPVHPAALPQGHSIADYEVVRVLGAGGFGITYLAFDHQLDGPVAIKEYFPAELASRVEGGQVTATAPANRETFSWGLERFLDEARAVHRFRHPNVVRAHRYLEANGTAYLVMEYVEGESLRSILDRRGTLLVEEWRPWMDALLDGLEHVHSHGYLIYALAATSYRALTGTLVPSVPDRILNDDYEPLADRIGGTDGQWLAAVDHGLAVRPENRPQTVEEWRAELAGTPASQSDAASAAPKYSITGPHDTAEPTVPTEATSTGDSVSALPQLVRRRPGVAALGALLLFGIAALSVVLLTKDISPDGTSENVRPLEQPDPAVAANTDTADPPPREEDAPLGSFRVVAEPSNSRVEFLNSEASYVPGMPLPSGQYRLQVSAPGYRSSETAIEHGASSTVLRIDLTAEVEAAGDSNVSSPNPPAEEETDPDAQFALGRQLILISIQPDQAHRAEEGVQWYRKAADQGHAEAQYWLGQYYEWGSYGLPENLTEAAAWYRKAADQGHAIAQVELGSMYLSGWGVPQDYGEALAWYRKAASKNFGLGSGAGQWRLGYMYKTGKGVPQNHVRAYAWYSLAAANGDGAAPGSMRNLRKEMTREQIAEAERLAAAWHGKAADQGGAEAQFKLGGMYFNGDGVPQDYREAAAWLRKASDQGHAAAQYNLGVLYFNGAGVPQDYVRAYAWLNVAAAQDHEDAEDAKEKRDTVGRRMTPEQIAEAQSLSRVLVSQ